MGKGNTLQGLHVVSILTVIFFILTLCGTASAGQLYVNETGWWYVGGDFNSSSTPIQFAINNATADDLIYVYSGSYNENVDVNKSLTLEGEGADAVDVSAASPDDHVFNVMANNVTISGFNVSGATSDDRAGIYATADNCNISNNIATNNDCGIFLQSSSNNTLDNNIANSNSVGIFLFESSNNNTLTSNIANLNSVIGIAVMESFSNTVSANNASSNEHGIALISSSNNTLINNIADLNSIHGILLWESSNNNNLTNNGVNSNNQGIVLGESSNYNTFTDNVANHNSDQGFYLLNKSNNNILINNTVNWNRQGINIESSIENNLTSNTANSNNDSGIILFGSSNNTLTNNTANSNSDGIFLFESSNSNTLMNNTANSSTKNHGIWLESSSDNTLINNTAGLNNEGGICLDYSSNNTITNNIANENNHSGIQLFWDSCDNTVTDNTANSNNDSGIFLQSSSNYNTLASNTADLNSEFGIFLQLSSNYNTLTSNTADLNSEFGIFLQLSSNNNLTSNIANSNNYSGIFLESSSNYNTLTSNTADSNNYSGIVLFESSNYNTLTSNTVDLNSEFGIFLQSSSNNNLASNTADLNNDCGIFLQSSSNNNTLTSNTADSNSVHGIALQFSSNNTLTNNTANSNNVHGIALQFSSNNTLTSNTLSGNNWDIWIEDSSSDFTNNTLNSTTVSFTYGGNVSLKGTSVASVGDPSGWSNISRFINVTNQSVGAWMILNFSYSDPDLSGLDESSLKVWKYNGTAWVEDGWNGTRHLDAANNVVGVNITSFSVFAPMAQPTPDNTLPVITDFKVEPNTSISTNNPAIASAYVSDAHLEEVNFAVADSGSQVSSNMTVLWVYSNESGVNGTYVASPWSAETWNITNQTVQDTVTIFTADWTDDLLVLGWFKQNGSLDEVEAISWFNDTTGELTNITMDHDAAMPVTIDDDVSTFKVLTIKFMDGLDRAPTHINGTTFTLYSIGNAGNPDLISKPVPSGTYTALVNAWDAAGNKNRTMVDVEVDNTLPVITDFKVEPNTSVSTNNPTIASAYVSDTHLEGVWFGIVDSSNLLDTNMTVPWLYINVSDVNGTYVTPPWYADAWNITNGTAENIVTTYHADWTDDLHVWGWFKQNGSADEVEAIFWFNSTGELINITMGDDAAPPVTIEDGVSTFKVSTMKFMDGLDGPSTYINGITFTLYSIGNASNPDLISKPVPSGTYTALVNAWDAAGNENCEMVNIDVDTTPPILSNSTPATGTTNLTPTISINATDIGSGINVSSANMTVNGMEVLLANTSSAFTYYFSNTTTTPYSHGDTVNVTFNVSDKQGHTSNYSWTFYIDNVTPTISITSPAGGYSTTASSISVSGTVNGTGSPPIIMINDVVASTTLANFNGTFTASVPISLGINTIYTNVTDAAGNINSTSISVTRTSPPTPPSGGGGGGGGGGSSGEPFENIEFKDVSRVYISTNADISFTFDKAGNEIQYINYKALTSQGYISAIIEVLKDTSTFAKEAAPGIICKNINIWVGTSGYATEANIENPVVGFKVEKKWIQNNDIEVSSIKLHRYHGDTWTALPTKRTDEDALYVHFESQTPGFSPFAITGQKKTLVAPPEPRALMSPPEPTPAITTPTEVETPPEPTPWGMYLLFGVVALVTIAGAYMYMRKRQG